MISTLNLNLNVIAAKFHKGMSKATWSSLQAGVKINYEAYGFKMLSVRIYTVLECPLKLDGLQVFP